MTIKTAHREASSSTKIFAHAIPTLLRPPDGKIRGPYPRIYPQCVAGKKGMTVSSFSDGFRRRTASISNSKEAAICRRSRVIHVNKPAPGGRHSADLLTTSSVTLCPLAPDIYASVYSADPRIENYNLKVLCSDQPLPSIVTADLATHGAFAAQTASSTWRPLPSRQPALLTSTSPQIPPRRYPTENITRGRRDGRSPTTSPCQERVAPAPCSQHFRPVAQRAEREIIRAGPRLGRAGRYVAAYRRGDIMECPH